jgi:hypothetical protein
MNIAPDLMTHRARGCPFEFRHYKYDGDEYAYFDYFDSDGERSDYESWTVDGCVSKGDDEGGLYFEGTLTENTVKGENGGRKCDIELRKPAFKCAFEKLEFTLTNFMRNGVTTKEKVPDFITWEDHEQLKRRIIDEVFYHYS